MNPFVHLHVHSQYSLLDGQASIDALVDKAMADGMPAMALTDHGTMFGIKEFFNYAAKVNKGPKKALKEAKAALSEAEQSGDPAAIEAARAAVSEAKSKVFKPILGCEVYVANNSLYDRNDKTDRGRHLIILAKNETGYHNLIKIVSKAWTEGFYSHPRTDKSEIEKHSEGLIVCSACLGGEIPRLLLAGDVAGAEKAVLWWKEHFGDDYYIELQRHKATVPRANHETYELQRRIEPQLIELARKHNIKIIATNDIHFVNEEDAEAHDRLICLSTNKYLADESRMLYSKQEWMKTTAEMADVFSDLPEALANIRVCGRSGHHVPAFRISLLVACHAAPPKRLDRVFSVVQLSGTPRIYAHHRRRGVEIQMDEPLEHPPPQLRPARYQLRLPAQTHIGLPRPDSPRQSPAPLLV